MPVFSRIRIKFEEKTEKPLKEQRFLTDQEKTKNGLKTVVLCDIDTCYHLRYAQCAK